MNRYLKFVFLMACRPDITILPPTEDLAEALCQRGLQCEIDQPADHQACLWCVNCFFELNGGAEKWRQPIGERLESRCDEVSYLASYAGIPQCITGFPQDLKPGQEPACVRGERKP